VQTLSVTYQLKHVGFLLIYFISLWAILRWSTHRKASKILDRWNRDQANELSLTNAVIDWTDELLQPLSQRKNEVADLLKRADLHREELALRGAA